MSADILARLRDTELVALCCDGADWPRTLLSDPPVPDAWMGLLETRDSRRRLVPAGDSPRAERGDTLVLVRNRPLVIPLEAVDLAASDGHAVSGRGEILVRLHAREDDLAALRTSLLSRCSELTSGQLAELFSNAGAAAALRSFARARPAAALVREEQREQLETSLRGELARFFFETGLSLERVANFEFRSQTLREQEERERRSARDVEAIRARQLVEDAARAATQRRLDDLGGLMAKLQTVASAAAEGTQWHDLLPALSPAERGRLLENLWRVTPDQRVAQAIVAVLDHDCVWLDPLDPEHLLRRVKLPEQLGGLRSVSFDAERRQLLIGAARGVWTISADDGALGAMFEAPATEMPRTGFNAATTCGSRLFATHSQLGCWSWRLDNPSDAAAVVRPENGRPKTIRAATALSDGRLALATDDSVRLFDESGREIEFAAGKLTSTILCLAAMDDWLFAGTEDGGLYGYDRGGADVWMRLHRAATMFETVHARRWNDLIELVIPGGAEGVLGVFAREGFVARLLESASPIRRSWACDDLIVGLSDRRDRLAVLSGNSPLRTGREAPIARLTGHTVQDACIVLKPVEAGRTGESA